MSSHESPFQNHPPYPTPEAAPVGGETTPTPPLHVEESMVAGQGTVRAISEHRADGHTASQDETAPTGVTEALSPQQLAEIREEVFDAASVPPQWRGELKRLSEELVRDPHMRADQARTLMVRGLRKVPQTPLHAYTAREAAVGRTGARDTMVDLLEQFGINVSEHPSAFGFDEPYLKAIGRMPETDDQHSASPVPPAEPQSVAPTTSQSAAGPTADTPPSTPVSYVETYTAPGFASPQEGIASNRNDRIQGQRDALAAAGMPPHVATQVAAMVEQARNPRLAADANLRGLTRSLRIPVSPISHEQQAQGIKPGDPYLTAILNHYNVPRSEWSGHGVSSAYLKSLED